MISSREAGAPETQRPAAGRATGKLLWLLLGGALLLAAVWGLRQYLLANIKMLPPVPSDAQIAVLLKQKQQQEAEARKQQQKLAPLQAAVQRAPSEVKHRWALADAYQKAGRLDLALPQLQAITRLRPGDPWSHTAIAQIRLAEGRWQDAEAICRQVVRRSPRTGQAWLTLATVLYHQGRYFEAIRAARQAVHHSPKNPSAYYVLATSYVEYAMQYPNPQTRSDELNIARRDLRRLLGVWPDKGDIYYRLGRACYGLRDSKTALRYLRRATELTPHHLDANLHMIRVYRAIGQGDKAVQVAEKQLARHPRNVELLAALGHMLATDADPKTAQRALQLFQTALQLSPNDFTLLDQIGLLQQRLGRMDEAQAAFERSIEINAEHSIPYQQLASIWSRRGDRKKAAYYAHLATGIASNEQQLKDIESLSRLKPNSVAIHLVLAERYSILRRPEVARDEYLQVLRLDPNNERARKGLLRLAAMGGADSRSTQTQAMPQGSAPINSTPRGSAIVSGAASGM